MIYITIEHSNSQQYLQHKSTSIHLWDHIDLRLNFSWHCCVTEVNLNKEKKSIMEFPTEKLLLSVQGSCQQISFCIAHSDFRLACDWKIYKFFFTCRRLEEIEKVNSTVFFNLKGVEFAHSICIEQSFMIRMLQYVEFVCKQQSHTLAAHYFR